MRFLAVDDEPFILAELKDTLEQVRPGAEVLCFTEPDEALAAVGNQRINAAFLDIQMGKMSGLQLALKLKKNNPDIRIVFVTGYSEYAVDAFAIHATGYLMKPVGKKEIERELTFIYGAPEAKKHIYIRTFGGFEISVDGEPVKFGRAKAKELLAYLVDRRGASVTVNEACAALFEDAGNTLSNKSYFRTVFHELVRALKEMGAEELAEIALDSIQATLQRGFTGEGGDPDALDIYYYMEGDQPLELPDLGLSWPAEEPYQWKAPA